MVIIKQACILSCHLWAVKVFFQCGRDMGIFKEWRNRTYNRQQTNWCLVYIWLAGSGFSSQQCSKMSETGGTNCIFIYVFKYVNVSIEIDSTCI